METVKIWNDQSYLDNNLEAQRFYPNEEFIRFFSRYIKNKTKNKRILELGHGIGSNIIPVIQEGFINVCGIDISEASVDLTNSRLNKLNLKCNLKTGNCLDPKFGFSYTFDFIIDVFSMYSMNNQDFLELIKNINNSLSDDGIFYSFFPSKNSNAFTNHIPSILLDDSTLNGIYRDTSPFYGNFYNFRFMYPFEYKNILESNGFKVIELNTITRNYNMKETFEWISIVAQKI